MNLKPRNSRLLPCDPEYNCDEGVDLSRQPSEESRTVGNIALIVILVLVLFAVFFGAAWAIREGFGAK
jgi:hypothetical protein